MTDHLQDATTFLRAFLDGDAVAASLATVTEAMEYGPTPDRTGTLKLAHDVLVAQARVATDVKVLVLHEDLGLTLTEIAEVIRVNPIETARIWAAVAMEAGLPPEQPDGHAAPSTTEPDPEPQVPAVAPDPVEPEPGEPGAVGVPSEPAGAPIRISSANPSAADLDVAPAGDEAPDAALSQEFTERVDEPVDLDTFAAEVAMAADLDDDPFDGDPFDVEIDDTDVGEEWDDGLADQLEQRHVTVAIADQDEPPAALVAADDSDASDASDGSVDSDASDDSGTHADPDASATPDPDDADTDSGPKVYKFVDGAIDARPVAVPEPVSERSFAYMLPVVLVAVVAVIAFIFWPRTDGGDDPPGTATGCVEGGAICIGRSFMTDTVTPFGQPGDERAEFFVGQDVFVWWSGVLTDADADPPRLDVRWFRVTDDREALVQSEEVPATRNTAQSLKFRLSTGPGDYRVEVVELIDGEPGVPRVGASFSILPAPVG